MQVPSQHRWEDACRALTGRSVSLLCLILSGGDVCEGPAAHPEWGQTLLSLSTCVPGLVNALQSLSSEEPFELVVEIMNPSLVHNESRSRCSKPDFKSNCC